MAKQRPQNPVFTVDAQILDACLPKVLCASCGTVIALRARKRSHRLRCPSCQAALIVEQQQEGLVTRSAPPLQDAAEG